MTIWMTLVIVFHVIITLAMVGVILLQKSEGGGLGIGGGQTGLMSARGVANLLTRTTSILAAIFIMNSILLAVMAGYNRNSSSAVEKLLREQNRAAGPVLPGVPAPATTPASPASPVVPDAGAATKDKTTPTGASPGIDTTATGGLPLPSLQAPAAPSQPADKAAK